jgi:hypothetical protein
MSTRPQVESHREQYFFASGTIFFEFLETFFRFNERIATFDLLNRINIAPSTFLMCPRKNLWPSSTVTFLIRT